MNTGLVALAYIFARICPVPVNAYQRRLRWLRQYFEVHTLGAAGFYSSPDGPLALARMTQYWMSRVPEYSVSRVGKAPPADLDAETWRQATSIRLVQGSTRPSNVDTNVGFAADLPSDVY